MDSTDTVGVLFLERVSAFQGAEKTDSIEAQDQTLFARLQQEQAKGRKVRHAGTAIDKGVSGAIDFGDRDGMGPWTADLFHTWDEIWVTKLDRSSRDQEDFLIFNFRLRKAGKKMVILNDPSFAFNTPMDVAMAAMKSMTPEEERRAIIERLQDSHDRRKQTAAFQANIPPYGYTTEYRVIDTPQGPKKRKVLVPFPHMVKIVKLMREWYMTDDEMTESEVVRRLNDMGELTSGDWVRVHNGRKPGERINPKEGVEYLPEMWQRHSVVRILTSLHLLGVKMTGSGTKADPRRPLYNPDGTYFRPYEAILTDEEFESLQAVLGARSSRTTGNASRGHPSRLKGVNWCIICHRQARIQRNRKRGKVYEYYRCTGNSARQIPPCSKVAMPADRVETYLSATFLEEEGESRDRKRHWDPGEDHTARIKELNVAVANLGETVAKVPAGPAQDILIRQLTEHNDELVALSKLPQRAPGWVYEEDGKTFGELWPSMDWEARRKLLIKRGVKFYIGAGGEWGIEVPPYWPGEEPVIQGEVLSSANQLT
ncbi:recombinase family protein [Streptomyces sp. NPDC056883]|uniref:recombinase family protein n=1 Tax=Streptomyces sp. NPDC056883 TaxID=3345959 RepID=UPI003699D217